MIPRHTATRETVTVLTAALDPLVVAHQRPPLTPPPSYIVVRSAPGSQRTGPQTAPVNWMNLRIDILAVATASNENLASIEAERISDLAAAAIFDYGTPISGAGWSVTGRTHIADSGVLTDANTAGATANITTTVDLYVVAAPASGTP